MQLGGRSLRRSLLRGVHAWRALATISLVRGGQGTFSDLRDVDWCCLIPASFVQLPDILLTNC